MISSWWGAGGGTGEPGSKVTSQKDSTVMVDSAWLIAASTQLHCFLHVCSGCLLVHLFSMLSQLTATVPPSIYPSFYPIYLFINLSRIYPFLHLYIHLALTQCTSCVLLPLSYLLADHVVQHGGDARAQRSKGVGQEQLGKDVQSAVGQEVVLRVRKVPQQRGQREENLWEAMAEGHCLDSRQGC